MSRRKRHRRCLPPLRKRVQMMKGLHKPNLTANKTKQKYLRLKSACCTSLRTWVQVPAPPKILGFVAQVPVTTAW